MRKMAVSLFLLVHPRRNHMKEFLFLLGGQTDLAKDTAMD